MSGFILWCVDVQLYGERMVEGRDHPSIEPSGSSVACESADNDLEHVGRVRICLVENVRIVADSLRSLLSEQENFQVLGQTPWKWAAVESLLDQRPDIIIVDAEGLAEEGVTATSRLRDSGFNGGIIVLLKHSEDGRLLPVLDAGADGCLPKMSTTGSNLVSSINAVMTGRSVIDSDLVANALWNKESELTCRELEVARTVALTGSTANTASALQLAAGTVRNYLSSVMGKLGAHSRLQAIDILRARGWL